MSETIHSYPWYPADWRGSEVVATMTIEERGLYRELLDFCWEIGDLPESQDSLRKLARAEKSEWKRCWPKIEQLFPIGPDGRRHNPKVDERRGELTRWHEGRREAGKRGAAKRWHGSANGCAIAEPLAELWLSNSHPHPHPSKNNPPTPLLAKPEPEPQLPPDCSDAYEYFKLEYIGEVPHDLWQRFPQYVNGAVDLLVANLSAWMRTRKYSDGFGGNADRFLRSGVWRAPPKPELMRRKTRHEEVLEMLDDHSERTG